MPGRRQLVRRLFRIALVVKGLDGLLELVGGVLFLVAPPGSISRVVVALTQHELGEDPHDLVAGALRHLAARISPDVAVFAAVYLLAHGVLKLVLVGGLARERPWVFPVAIGVFGLFVVYQLYRFSVGHSAGMLALTALDLAVIALTVLEYRNVRAASAPPARASRR